MARYVYKVLAAADWAAAVTAGRYGGSADDKRDGFIHLSTAAQLPGTLARHFANEPGLVLVRFDADRLGSAVRWEPSRGGMLFPHFYGSIDPALAEAVDPLALGPDGRHRLPEELA